MKGKFLLATACALVSWIGVATPGTADPPLASEQVNEVELDAVAPAFINPDDPAVPHGDPCPFSTIVYEQSGSANTVAAANNNFDQAYGDEITLAGTDRNICTVEVSMGAAGGLNTQPYNLELRIYQTCPAINNVAGACGANGAVLIHSQVAMNVPATGGVVHYDVPNVLVPDTIHVVFVPIPINPLTGAISPTFATDPIEVGNSTNFVTRCGSTGANNGCTRNFNNSNDWVMTIWATNPVPGACCLDDGSCNDTTLEFATACTAAGGAWHPGDCGSVSCPQPGACCADDGVTPCQENVLPGDCPAGYRHAPNTLCANLVPACGAVVGACCLSNGSCQSLTGTACVGAGGIWRPGNCATFRCEDYCESPITVTDGTTAFTTIGATTDGPTAGELPDCGATTGTNDIWFRYSSPLTATGGYLSFSICSANYDSTLQIYENPNCADIKSGAQAANTCDDDGCGFTGGGSQITAHSVGPGNLEILIRVGGFNGAAGSGNLIIGAVPFNSGACCRVTNTCSVVADVDCAAPDFFASGLPCSIASACGPIGGCCRGAQGCVVTYQQTCGGLGGTFLGGGTSCGSAGDCDGDGETDFCTIALGGSNARHDCNGNGIPDGCDITSGASQDCQGGTGDGIPDDCQLHLAGQVRDNGPFITSFGNGPNGSNLSQIEAGENTFGYTSNNTIRLADDFTVTDPNGVLLDSITVRAYQTDAVTPGGATNSTFTGVFLAIWNGPPGNPGANQILGSNLTVNRIRLAQTAFSNVYRVAAGAPAADLDDRAIINVVGDMSWVSQKLMPGTYWIEWGLTGSLASGPFCPPIVPHSAGSNARQLTGAGWAQLAGALGPVDFPYLLTGRSAATPCNDCDTDGVPNECDSACASACPTVAGDLNGDGQRTGADIQKFTNCVLAGPTIAFGCGADCRCADMDGSGTATVSDVAGFVAALLQ